MPEVLEKKDEALERVLALAKRATRELWKTEEMSPTGIPRPKSRTRRQLDQAIFDTLTKVLDNGFHWYGPWGQTRAAIELELTRQVRAEDEAAQSQRSQRARAFYAGGQR